MTRRAIVVPVVAFSVLVAAPSLAQQHRSPVRTTTLTKADRASFSLTVYNDGFGLVRQVRNLSKVRPGPLRLVFRGIAPQIEAPSVSLRVLPNPSSVRVLEQSYLYDALSPSTLVRRSLGSRVSLYRFRKGSGALERLSATVLGVSSSRDGRPALVRGPDGITHYDDIQTVGYSALPKGWISEPSLAWLLDVRRAGVEKVDVSYLTTGVSWSADYVLVLAPKPADASMLSGWVTVKNGSGMDFGKVHLAVVAGKVNRASRGVARGYYGRVAKAKEFVPVAKALPMSSSRLSEFYLYRLPGVTDLPSESSKQIAFVGTSRLHPERCYVINLPRQSSWSSEQQSTRRWNARLQLRFRSDEQQGLSVPLPKGTVRVFSADSSGRQQFIAQTSIGHTPKDELVKLTLRVVPDIWLRRSLVDRKEMVSYREDVVSYELHNASTTAARVRVTELLPDVRESTLPAAHPDAATTEYVVTVPSGQVLRWRATYRVAFRGKKGVRSW